MLRENQPLRHLKVSVGLVVGKPLPSRWGRVFSPCRHSAKVSSRENTVCHVLVDTLQPSPVSQARR